MRPTRVHAVAFAVAIAALLPGVLVAQGPVEYVFTPLIGPPEHGGLRPFDITNSGAVLARSEAVNVTVGLVLKKGRVSTFMVPGATLLVPASMTDSGIIVGTYWDAANQPTLFVRNQKGKLTSFAVPGQWTFVTPWRMNNRGAIVGWTTAQNGSSHGFVTDASGVRIVNLPGATDTTLLGINDVGTAVGFWAAQSGESGPFIRDPDGTMTKLVIPGAINVSAFDINNRGEIAGVYQDAATFEDRGFVLRGDVFSSFDYVPPAIADCYSPDLGTTITGQLFSTFMNVMGINDRGQVVGSNIADYIDPATGGSCTQIDAFIASPVH